MHVPSGTTTAGLLNLTQHGELFFLPAHNAHHFRALIVTQAKGTCRSVEDAMLDVRNYPKRWPKMTDVSVLSDKHDRVHYRFALDMMFSPEIEGIVERTGPGTVRFEDPKVAGDFSTWKLRDVGRRCSMVFHLQHKPGRRSDFVRLVQNMEKGIADSAELAGALASARGYTGLPSPTRRYDVTTAGRGTWEALSGRGTVMRAIRRPGGTMVFQARRQIEVPPSEVIARLRDRERSYRTVDFLSDVDHKGELSTKWDVSYFGGWVDFETHATEKQDGPVYRRTETVKSGDISQGYWTWTVTPVPGGTALDLEVDLDVRAGSRVLRTLAAQDPIIGNSTGMQVSLEFMRVLGQGKSLRVEPTMIAQGDSIVGAD